MKNIKAPIAVAGLGFVLLLLSFFDLNNLIKGEVELGIEIDKADFIMPAAHRVYSNPDALEGKYYLFKAKIDNESDRTLEDVTVRYRVPGYIDWTKLSVSGLLFPGQSLIVPCYPKFPDNISEKNTPSVEKVEIEISWDGAEEDDIINEEFGFKLTNRNEYVYTGIKKEEIAGWADIFDNSALIACFVTPNDPIVKYYTQNLQEKLLKGEAASVSNKPEDGVRFMLGIYEATRKAHMVYSGTKGVPQSTDDVQSVVQQIRLPREVITGNTGLCIELSTLYASIMSAAGLNPVIYFIPGHAYPGFRMNGQYYAIEATAIGGEGLGKISSAEEAFKRGQEELQEFMKRAQMGDPRYTLVDIHAINQRGIVSMDLKDDSFLRKKVDEIAKSWTEENVYAQKEPVSQGDTGAEAMPSPSPETPSFTNPLSMQIPPGWQVYKNPMPQMPILTAQIVSPNETITANVYDIPAGNVQQALQIISQNLTAAGLAIDYQINGNSLTGQTYYGNIGTFYWLGKILPTNRGIRIVTVGSIDYLYQQNSTVINQVYNSIR